MLDKMLDFWKSKLRRTDPSVSNTSSMALLVQHGKWRALLCADNTVENIVEGLAELLGEHNKPYHFNVVTCTFSSCINTPHTHTPLCTPHVSCASRSAPSRKQEQQ